jgi:hypothetical protein
VLLCGDLKACHVCASEGLTDARTGVSSITSGDENSSALCSPICCSATVASPASRGEQITSGDRDRVIGL